MGSEHAVKELLRNNLSIPTLPEVVMRVNALIEDADSGTAEIGALVAEDAPLAAKVLRISNSAYYGLAGNCVSTSHACTVLGVKVLKNIVTQVAVIGLFEHLEGGDVFDVQGLWGHASFTGHLCSEIAKHSNATQLTPEEYYVCGLLHDVGKVVMLDGLGPRYLEIVKQARSEGRPLHAVERLELGYNHTDVGAMVASRWDLPDSISQAIQFHHGPRNRVAESPLVSLVAHANLLAHRAVAEGPVETVFSQQVRDQLGLLEHDVAAIVEFAWNLRKAT